MMRNSKPSGTLRVSSEETRRYARTTRTRRPSESKLGLGLIIAGQLPDMRGDWRNQRPAVGANKSFQADPCSSSIDRSVKNARFRTS